MEPGHSLTYSQEPDSDLCLEPFESRHHLRTISWTSLLIFYSHLFLYFSSCLFLSISVIKCTSFSSLPFVLHASLMASTLLYSLCFSFSVYFNSFPSVLSTFHVLNVRGYEKITFAFMRPSGLATARVVWRVSSEVHMLPLWIKRCSVDTSHSLVAERKQTRWQSSAPPLEKLFCQLILLEQISVQESCTCFVASWWTAGQSGLCVWSEWNTFQLSWSCYIRGPEKWHWKHGQASRKVCRSRSHLCAS
jgi:hypothetical protein